MPPKLEVCFLLEKFLEGGIIMKRVLALLFVFLVIGGIHSTYSYAAESQGFLFTVEMTPPINQIGNVGYYHVPGKPGEHITLKAKLTNLTNQPLEVKVVPMNAYSAQDGIFYQSPEEVNSQVYTLVDVRYGLAQYMTETTQITLLPKQTEVVSVSIAVPNLDIGTLLGSIRFVVFEGTHEVQKSDEQKKTSQILIDKYQAIDTAIQIDLPQQDKSAISVGNPTFDGDKTNVDIEIINQAALIQENISGAYEIRDKENIILFEGAIRTFKMSPMTKFQYPIPWRYKTLEPGTYSISLKLNVDGKEMNFQKPLIIKNKAVAQVLKKQAEINPQVKMNTLWIWLVMGSLVIIIIVLLFFTIKSRFTKSK